MLTATVEPHKCNYTIYPKRTWTTDVVSGPISKLWVSNFDELGEFTLYYRGRKISSSSNGMIEFQERGTHSSDHEEDSDMYLTKNLTREGYYEYLTPEQMTSTTNFLNSHS